MSRGLLAAIPFLLALTDPLAAQQSLGTTQGTPPERVDLLAQSQGEVEGPQYEDCSAEQEAAIISGAIIVCRRKVDNNQYYDADSGQDRYAAQTMNKGDPKAPDVAGPGIFRGPATVGKMCFPGISKCPPPPAYMVDFKTLPEAPAGSDADRVARGLAPRGGENPPAAPKIDPRIEELGLPDPAAVASPVPPGDGAAVSPSGSASTTAAP